MVMKLELTSETSCARMSTAWVGNRYGLESSLSQGPKVGSIGIRVEA